MIRHEEDKNEEEEERQRANENASLWMVDEKKNRDWEIKMQ